MDLAQAVRRLGENARTASRILANAKSSVKNGFLAALAEILLQRESRIMAENAKDVELAKSGGMDEARLNRLALTPKIFAEMAAGCREVAAMPDPIGATETQWQRPNGLLVGKMRMPLGVIAMIYEARPNVAIDAAILCIKAGNAVILRGGKEAANSTAALGQALQDALKKAGLPPECAQIVDIPGHEAVKELCRLDEFIDVVIPRGGEGLIRAVCDVATVPVLKHYKGVCHCYVDKGANLEEACIIVANSKMQRPGVCNALECLLVHREEARAFLPMLARKLAASGLEFRADAMALPLLGNTAVPLKDGDFGREFHAPILAVAIVDDMDAALSHIDLYGSRHTDIICTRNYNHALRFLREVDASMVAVNASTRFNDGGQLGLGAEIGISTSKLHAYGPMGVKELTTTKFVVLGSGQTRA